MGFFRLSFTLSKHSFPKCNPSFRTRKLSLLNHQIYGHEDLAQIKINIHEATKKKFQQLAQEKNCTVTDIARKALYEYLAQQEKITA